jgi:putative PEP-CTERM system histidine kinase
VSGLLGPLLPAAAGLVCAALALGVFLWRPAGRVSGSFALGMLAFAAQSGAAWALLASADEAANRLMWLRIHGIAALVAPLCWGYFIGALVRRPAATLTGWRSPLVLASALVVVAGTTLVVNEAFLVSIVAGPFDVAAVTAPGVYVAVLEVLLSVALLARLETALRSTGSRTRGRIKFLALGLGGIFLVRFYLASQVVAFRVVTDEHLKIGAATLLIATVLIGAGAARERLRTVEVTVSRDLLYRSAVITVLGTYLFAVGVLGWLLNYLQIPEKAFWGSLIIFVSALFLALVLLSERVRWRVKRFVGLHLYRSKYDYREQWGAFTRRMASLVTVHEIGPQLLQTISETVGSTRAALYLADADRGPYTVVAEAGLAAPAGGLTSDVPLVARLRDAREPMVLNGDADVLLPSGLAGMFGEGSVAVPLVWRGTLSGFLLVGPERTGMPYGPEDLIFMATMGEQAAGSIATARISDALARTREFDAFNRITSYVIHDVKNSASALSLLARNALTHFDDPEFQRDTIRTLSKTVDRMNGLLAKLESPREAGQLVLEPLELGPLVDELVRALRADPRLEVVTHVSPTPAVLGDPDALLRALQNLVKNAAEAIVGPGRITISAGGEDGAAVVSVTDTGPGMSPEFVQTSLFAPFRSTKKGGWGIGLFQARDIVERHGGTIAIISAPGRGSTFRMRLPAAGREPASPDAERPRGEAAAADRTGPLAAR